MVRRGWVIVLMAAALLVYLVMPDQPTTPPYAASTATSVAFVHADHASHDHPGQPDITSDDVTVAPRSVLDGHPPPHDHACPDVSHTGAPGRDCGAGRGARTADGALDALRPALSALQVLRY
ncbi:hypothetical protein ACFWRZ_32045 [Streptomyces rubiginosohelvolus]|uniref:hypothetical protein n=1 Tax=Streptomyces TaxID=1883 RepID=UPI00332D2708